MFTFPSNLRRWLAVFFTSVVMSLVHGAIFWNVRSSHQGTLPEQEDINDRLALHYVMASVALWPTLMLMINDVWKEKDSMARDIKDRLFGRFVHFISKVSFIPFIFLFDVLRTSKTAMPNQETLLLSFKIDKERCSVRFC